MCAKVCVLISAFFFFLVGAKEGAREMFDDPSYVNVDKPRPPVATNGNAHRDAFDMSKRLSILVRNPPWYNISVLLAKNTSTAETSWETKVANPLMIQFLGNEMTRCF